MGRDPQQPDSEGCRQNRKGWLIAVALLTACGKEAAPRPTPFEENLAVLRSPDPHQRRLGAGSMKVSCCSRLSARFPDEAPIACRALAGVLETEQESQVLLAAVVGWEARCYRDVPAASVVAALENAKDDRTRDEIIRLLGEIEPNDLIVGALLRQLGRPELRVRLAMTFGSYGEPEVRRLMTRLHDPDVEVRRTVVRAMWHVVEAPLALPHSDLALDGGGGDPAGNGDEEVSKFAHLAADRLRERQAESVESAVARLQTTIPDDAARLFGRRKVFCDSAAASAFLERLAADADENPTRADIAQRALATRRVRCGSSTGGG